MITKKLCSSKILILIILFGSISAQDDKDCSWPELPNWGTITNIYRPTNELPVNATGIIFTSQNFQNVQSISIMQEDVSYLDATFNQSKNILEIYTTEKFKKINETENLSSITLTITFHCSNKFIKILYFKQSINTSNIYEPKFSQENYIFQVPLPLRQGSDLTDFQEISAIDWDIKYNNITFFSKVPHKLISVTNSNKIKGKTYYASLNLNKDLNVIEEDITFTIYARDNDIVSPKESSVQITISANLDQSIPPQPRFHQVIYNGQLNNRYELTINDKIDLLYDTYSENVTFSKTGKDEKLFNIVSKLNVVEIELADKITADHLKNKTNLQFEIVASNSKLNETGRAGVIVTFPISFAKLHFDKTIYYGKININSQLELEDLKIMGNIDNPDNIKFLSSGNDNKFFQLNRIDGNSLQVHLNDNINSSELNSLNFLSLNIWAELDNNTIASCTVIIDILKETDIFFSKSFYNGNFNDFNNYTIEKIEILESSYTETVKFYLEGNDSEYFNYTQVNNTIKINFNKLIYPDEWKLKKFISFNVRAKKSKVPDQTAGILITLMDQNFEIPEFEKTIYKGQIITINKLLQNIELEKINLKNLIKNIKYILTGNEVEYFEFNEEQNEILIKTPLPDEILQNHRFLSLTLIAKTEYDMENFTSIILETPQKTKDIILNFSKPLYKGSLDEKLKLSVEIIEFTNNLIVTDIYLREPDAKYFKVSMNQSNVIFQLNDNLTENDVIGRKNFFCLIKAKSESNTESTAAILIDITQNNNGDIVIPKFSKNIYNGKIITNMKIELEEEITLTFPLNNIVFQITGEFEKYFDIDLKDNHINIYVSNPLPNNELQNNAYLSLILIGKGIDQKYSNFTTIILKTPEKNLNKPLEFTKSLYKGSIDKALNFTIEKIEFKNVIKLKRIYVTGIDEQYFQANATDSIVSLKLIRDLNENDVRDKKYLECMIVAETENDVLSVAVVITDIDELPPTTTPVPPFEPKFEKDYYIFTIMSNILGPFGSVNIVESEKYEVEYKLEINNEHAKSRISINKQTGELRLNSDISPGVYVLIATAKTNVTSALARTDIQIEINPINICNETTQVLNSLVIKNIPEEQINYDILQMKQNNCMFKIFDMDPIYEKYFSINTSTNMLNSIAIDRENEEFSHLEIVQIQLKLVLSIVNEYEIPNQYLSHNEITTNYIQSFNFNRPNQNKQYILTNDIIFNPLVTMLSIIIDDINDNKPEFINPSKSEIFIGYPNVELSEKILPEYLIKVNAIDKDIGLNAVIRYKILLPTNNDFGIDEKTGIIYPYSNALQNVDETILNVYAIDCDGEPNGLNSSIKIIVKKLNSHNLVLFTYEDEERVKINNVLKNISSEIGLNLINLNNAIVPSDENNFNFKFFYKLFGRVSDKKTLVLKTWIYSLDENNLPISAAIIKDKISKVSQNSDVKVERYEDTISSRNSNEIDVTRYVVTISLLSVICICLIGFLIWIYYFRPMIYKRLSTPSLEKMPPFTSVHSLDPNTVYSNQVEKCDSPLSTYLKRESVKIFGSTTKETSSDGQQNSRIDDNHDNIISDTESNSDIIEGNLEKRKSIVTFNEMVERIDIESDTEDQRDSVNSSIRL